MKEVNNGCYDGKWGGAGDVLTSYSPHNGKAIAQVVQATEDDYESALTAMDDAQTMWQEVRHSVNTTQTSTSRWATTTKYKKTTTHTHVA